jgi:hypothetical protein
MAVSRFGGFRFLFGTTFSAGNDHPTHRLLSAPCAFRRSLDGVELLLRDPIFFLAM